MISLKLATFCDAATVREGLLSILGGGITVLNRDSYPSPLAVTLALSFEVMGVPEGGATHEIKIVTSHVDGEGTELFSAEGHLQFWAAEGEKGSGPQSVPLIFPLADAGIEREGMYRTDVSVDGEHAGSLHFDARIVNTEVSFSTSAS